MNTESMPSVMVVDDEPFARRYFEAILKEEGYHCTTFGTAGEGLAHLSEEKTPDLAIIDIRLPDGNGLEILEWAGRNSPDLPVIIITAYGSIDEAVTAMKLGAFDFFTKPFDDDHRIRLSLRNALEKKRLTHENRLLKSRLHHQGARRNIVGCSAAMTRVFELIEKAARVDSTILIEGASGTGKELVAEAIHQLSDRKDRAFIPINCAALPETLLESALFGYEKGAFSGAWKTTRGFFEEADGGALFLDEIGDAPQSVQAKILRAVEDGSIYRVGRTRPIQVNVRLIFATNKDLGREVDHGVFRRDLYYRINIIRIQLPALADRPEDIPLLIHHFLDKYCSETGIPKKRLTYQAMDDLIHRPWPGNVRELKNLMERLVVLHPEEEVTARALARYGEERRRQPASDWLEAEYEQAKTGFERRYFERLMKTSGNDYRLAAKISGIHLATIYRKLKALGLKTD